MRSLSTIGVHTHITNPLSSGYLAYLACIESWAKVVDEVVVVDGGSTDDSIAFLMNWLGPLGGKVKVVWTQESSWGKGDLWCWPQIAINRQIGLDALNADWAIHVDADHVLDDSVSRDTLQHELEKSSKPSRIQSFWVSAFDEGRLRRRIRTRAWIVNKRSMVNDGARIAYGIEEGSGSHLDYPVYLRKYSCFLDPLTNVKKRYWVGPLVEWGSTLDIDVVRYGHFFFTPDQFLYKCRRLDAALSRYVGRAPSATIALLLQNKVAVSRPNNGVSKDELLSWPHPSSIKRVIAEFYQADMLGGLIYKKSILDYKLESVLLALLRAERWLRTVRMRAQGYRGIRDLHQWVPVDAPDPEPLDVRAIYMEQDKYLPPEYRIGWKQAVPSSGAVGI
jgi:hypothetical protein